MSISLSEKDQRQLDTMERIAELLHRRLQQRITAAEAGELERWLAAQSPAARQFYESIQEWPALEKALLSMEQVDEKAALQEVWDRIGTIAPQKETVVRKMSWWRIAAAVVVLLTGIGMLWKHYAPRPPDSLPIAARYQGEALPGGNRATLQLADGSIITLDSAANGTLARQQQAVVKKTAEGTLQYEPVGAAKEAAAVFNAITTPRGGQYQVVLPDGTRVWLNAASSLRYPTAFTGQERVVELSGEAYFEVAPQADKHFLVKTGGEQPADITVLGTAFNVNAYADQQNNVTTLVNGKVRVSGKGGQVVLQPSQQVVTARGMSPVVRAANLEAALAWKEGLFSLEGAGIEEIMQQIARWYDVEIIYQGKIEQQFVGKIPRNMKLSAVLKVLESTGWVHFSISGKTVTVAP
ncbi:FecR domain-containing protein [Chitinophaga oryzae]|uniref:FecR domain-containing protein n=1 Tax=Chitinophaga oryzae TaxID=2725414 RepID=A0AAE6ZJ79_9BACT|nr:FecR family protein [Chitinophaga oryzae]QJB32709.1 FecR domain-containing protein [Chitinophaga oryzae]